MNDSLLQYLRQLGLTDLEISDLLTEDNINWVNEYLDAFGTSEQVLKNTAHSSINAKRNKRPESNNIYTYPFNVEEYGERMRLILDQQKYGDRAIPTPVINQIITNKRQYNTEK